MARKILQISLVVIALAFMVVKCGNSRGFNPPSDEDMIRNFHAHESVFNEIAKILSNCPYGSTYPPFYPIERAEDSLCLANLGSEKCARLDRLLAAVGSERVYFQSRHSFWQVEHHDYSSIPPVEELSDTIAPRISVIYYQAGWSIGPSLDKGYVYELAYTQTDTSAYDLNEIYEIIRNDPNMPGGGASKRIKGDWYIELSYDK